MEDTFFGQCDYCEDWCHGLQKYQLPPTKVGGLSLI